jgi:hypothetical protein
VGPGILLAGGGEILLAGGGDVVVGGGDVVVRGGAVVVGAAVVVEGAVVVFCAWAGLVGFTRSCNANRSIKPLASTRAASTSILSAMRRILTAPRPLPIHKGPRGSMGRSAALLRKDCTRARGGSLPFFEGLTDQGLHGGAV